MSPRVGLDRKQIIQTAAELANAEGIEALTLSTVARKLNVRPPSLFNHIDGLQSIKRELSLYGLNLLCEKLEVATNSNKENEAILSIAKAYVQFAREQPGVYELTLRAPEPNDQEIEVASNQILYLISKHLTEYNLSDEDKVHAIRALRSILHGFSTLEQKGAFGLPINTEKSFELMVQGFIGAIKNQRA